MRRLIYIFLLLMPFVGQAADAPLVHSYQLKNGLTVIVREDHRAPVVLSSIWYKVGSTYEQNGTTGISHALEHMMFRGTKRFGAGEFVNIVNKNGGLQNAMTTNDYTVYYQFLPANKLDVSFQLEADRMRHLLLTEADFSKEIQVVMEERRMNFEDNPQSMAWVLLNSVAATNSPDQHPTIGWKGDLQQMTVNDLRAWYRSWYGPNNAVMVVVGDVKPDEVYALAKQYFASLPTINLPVRKKFIPEPYVSTRNLTVKLPAKLPLLMMAYNTPSQVTATINSDPYALILLADILGNGNSARLAQNLVRKQQIATNVSVDYDPYRLVDSLFTIMVIPSSQNSTALPAAVLTEIKKIQQDGVSASELARAKAQFIAEYIYDKDSLMNQAMEIGIAEMIGVGWQDGLQIVQKIDAITPEQIQSVAKRYLQANRLTVEYLEPLSINTTSQQPLGEPHEQTILH